MQCYAGLLALLALLVITSEVHAEEPFKAVSAEETPTEQRKLLILPVHAPSLKKQISNTLLQYLSRAAKELGYEVFHPRSSKNQTQPSKNQTRLRSSSAPSIRELWQAAYTYKAHRAVSLEVWVSGDRYIGELQVASLDGRGPYHGRATGKNDLFLQRVEELLAHLLPSSDLWDESEAAYWAQYTETLSQKETTRKKSKGSTKPFLTPREQAIALAQSRRLRHRFSLAAQSESVIGASSNFYYNHLAGIRFDFRISETLATGIYLGYINSSGRNERSHNLLSYAQIEHRIFFSYNSDISIPLRFGLGYLPFNGPVVRTSAGLNLPLGERLEIGFDVISPTIWVLPNSTTLSFNFGAEAIVRF